MKYIVDGNLPKRFKFFNKPDFIFSRDIDPRMSDRTLWDYALKHDLIILTKDTDFYERSLIAKTKPRIVYFNIGNNTLKQLHEYFRENWDTIEILSINFIKQS